MDRNSLIGILLIFGLFYLWARINAPSEEEQAEMQRAQDSIAALEDTLSASEELVRDSAEIGSTDRDRLQSPRKDSLQTETPPPSGEEEQVFTLENDRLKIEFSNIGGRITDVLVKDFSAIQRTEEGEDIEVPLHLMNDERERFEYVIPKGDGGYISTGALAFEAEVSNGSIRFNGTLPNGGRAIFEYSLAESGYTLDFQVRFEGLDQYMRPNDEIQLNWINYLKRLEKPAGYEETYTTTHYKELEESPTSLSWTSEDQETLSKGLRWISQSNQFFNSSLISTEGFDGGHLEIAPFPAEESTLKLANSTLTHKVRRPDEALFEYDWYIGPNDFNNMTAMGHDLEDVIPYGWSIFGTINRWVIRPVFDFLSGAVGSLGIAIIILTFVIKLVLYPLTYRMLHSQSKMAALKPEISKIREKHKDDSNTQQMETMKLYREFGVNPLGGCMPMLLQMPIWFALYRFFPSSIEFRQESFLWADDLSTYDVFMELPFYIPAYGDHVSLFTLLWAVSLFGYTMYNMRHMDNSMMQSNPMMKYMQYLMPVMFLFFLNSYSSGLTCYLLFSNLFNITQTAVTKNFVFNEDKIKAELQKNKEKPKKKSGFRARLEQAMEEQRKQQDKKGKKKKK